MSGSHLNLRLHGKLIRHQNKEILFRPLQGFPDYFFINKMGFAAAGTSQNQL